MDDFENKESESHAGIPEFTDWAYNKERNIELGGRADFFKLRKQWSGYLFWFLTATLLFQFALAFMIGFGLVSFPANTVIYIIVGENFVQIIGLVLIVVKFLFSSGEE